MTRITCDTAEKPIVVSIAHFCKSFCVYRTRFRAVERVGKCHVKHTSFELRFREELSKRILVRRCKLILHFGDYRPLWLGSRRTLTCVRLLVNTFLN